MTDQMRKSKPPRSKHKDKTAFPLGLISLHFDDGHISVFLHAVPHLTNLGLKSDQYLVSNRVTSGNPDYISTSQMLQIQSEGHCVGGHTRSHPRLIDTTAIPPRPISQGALQDEVQGGRDALVAAGATPVLTFAYPFGLGSTNDVVRSAIGDAGFTGARSTQDGFNRKDADSFALKRKPADRLTTSFAGVSGWIDQAREDRSWLILVFHRIDDIQEDYHTSRQLFEQSAEYVHDQVTRGNLRAITTSQGLALMQEP